MTSDKDTRKLIIRDTPEGDVTFDIRTNIDLPPNELNEYRDAFLLIYDALPEDTHPLWKIAIESVLFGGEGLAPNVTDYSRQMHNKNDHSTFEYCYHHGDIENDIDLFGLETFHNIPTNPPRSEDKPLFDSEIELPVAPESKKVLPVKVNEDEISDAVSLLNEFPVEPLDINSGGRESNLLNPEMFPGVSSPSDQLRSSNNEDREGPKQLQGSRGPEAVRAHRRAQQRDPSDVVEIGEVTSLVIKEADYSSRPPTIMGTKNKLVVWVKEAPQNLSKNDTVKVKIVDYGGKNRSAESVFIDRLD